MKMTCQYTWLCWWRWRVSTHGWIDEDDVPLHVTGLMKMTCQYIWLSWWRWRVSTHDWVDEDDVSVHMTELMKMTCQYTLNNTAQLCATLWNDAEVGPWWGKVASSHCRVWCNQCHKVPFDNYCVLVIEFSQFRLGARIFVVYAMILRAILLPKRHDREGNVCHNVKKCVILKCMHYEW